MIKNSLDAFEEWFNSLPPEHKTDIAAMVSCLFPGMDVLPIPGTNFENQFIGWISSQKTDSLKTIGTILALKAIIDYSIMNNRDSKEDWKETAEKMKITTALIKQRLGNEHGEMIENISQQSPLRSAQWINSAASWKKLCEEHFTKENLDKIMSQG